jgi:hypothetical protein
MFKLLNYFFKEIENLIFSTIFLGSIIPLIFKWVGRISMTDNIFSIFITLLISSVFLMISSFISIYQNFNFFYKLVGNYKSYSFVHGPDENCNGMIEKHKLKPSKYNAEAKIEYLGKDELGINVNFIRNNEENRWVGLVHMNSKHQGEVLWEYIIFDGKYVPIKKDVYMKWVKKINIFCKKNNISFALNEMQNRNFRDQKYKIKSEDLDNELVLGEMKREIFQKA